MSQTESDSVQDALHQALVPISSLSSLGDLICCVAYGLFAIYFAHRSLSARLPVTALAMVFLAALVTSAVWAGVALADGLRHWSDRMPIWIVASLDLLRFGLWFVFLLMLLPVRRGVGLGWVKPVIGVAMLFQLMVIAMAEGLPPGTLARPQAFGALALAVLGLVLVEQMLRNTAADARWNAKPFCLGLGGIFAFELFIGSQAALFQRFDGDAVSVRSLVHAAAVPLLFVASRRHGDWLDKLHVSRAAAFHSAALLLVGAYLLVVAGVGYYVRYTGGEWGRALSVALVFFALVALALLMASGSIRSQLRVYISKNFFSYRYDYREEWLRFTRLLSNSVEAQHTAETVVRALANLVESPSGMVWLQRSADGEFVQAARWNLPAQVGSEGRDSALALFWRERAWIIDVDEWRQRPQAYPGLELPEWLVNEPRCWLVVPLLVRESSLIGFAVLGKPRAIVELNWEVRDLLRTAASQASGYLAQSQATEALLEARKFDAFNRMSAFVVHDLKNIVTQLSLMMKNAKRLRDNPEFQQDMLDTVENSLEKMRQLMLQLREGDKPHGITSGVDLEQIAKRLAAAASSKGRALELQLQPGVSTRGHAERVERVLGHVVQNAFDATPADGEVRLTLDAEGSQARVRVTDTGCGMSEEFIQNRLFKPFQTTKASGMGIGAHESYQYVQELGGKISVQSELNRGTTVTLLLPLFHAQVDALLVAR